MRKFLVCFGMMLLLVTALFSNNVAVLTDKQGNIYKDYTINEQNFLGDLLYNNIVSLQNQQGFNEVLNKPDLMLQTITNLTDFLVVEKYINEKNITLSATEIESGANALFVKYMSDAASKKNILDLFKTEDNFMGFCKSQTYKDEVKNKLQSVFVVSEESIVDYLTKNFEAIRAGISEQTGEATSTITKEKILANEDIVSQVRNELFSELLNKWFGPYREKFDIKITYKPLDYQIKIAKANNDEKLLDNLEEEFRINYLEDSTIPEEWKISYVVLTSSIDDKNMTRKQEIESYLNYAENYPVYAAKTVDELNKEMAKIEESKVTLDATGVQKADETIDILNQILDLKTRYTEEIKSPEKVLGEIDTLHLVYSNALKIILNELNDKYPNNDGIIMRLYNITPDNAKISYQYWKLYYNYVVKYLDDPQSAQMIFGQLVQIKDEFEKLSTNDDLDTESINDIKELLKNIDDTIKIIADSTKG